MTRASKATQANKKLNADLDFGVGSRRTSSSAAGQRTGDISAEERKRIKEQLRDWRAKKNVDNENDRLERIEESKQR